MRERSRLALQRTPEEKRMRRVCIRSDKNKLRPTVFPLFTEYIWPIRFDFTNFPNGDSCQSGLPLQLFPMETIVLVGQNNQIIK